MNVIYRVRTASKEQIRAHLQACDADFAPPLSSRVDLDAYSAKIHERAVSFEAWDEGLLVGVLNAYLNDRRSRIGYITNLSVLKGYMGQGIGSILMHMCLEQAWSLGYSRVRAQVARDNVPMNRLVQKAGFRVMGDSGEWIQIECEIGSQQGEEPA